ncbi:MAG: hypothetical protein WKG00_19105 [Polyangiaceae bacterium]
MKTFTRTWAMVGATLLFAAGFASGCSDDEDDNANPTTSSTPSSASGTGASGGEGGSGATGGTAGQGGQGGNPDEFVFDTTPVGDFVQTDRHGAVEAGTVGISAPSGLGLGGEDITLRDAYNASNPVEDAAGMWVDEITASLNALHGALDDNLTMAGLTPATTAESLVQAAPVIVPDTIKFDPTKPVAYPNGRALTDQVVDITIAAALVKLDTDPPTPLNVLAELPLNPVANDVAFKPDFPYLADPH